jgi:hypothetical protein
MKGRIGRLFCHDRDRKIAKYWLLNEAAEVHVVSIRESFIMVSVQRLRPARKRFIHVDMSPGLQKLGLCLLLIAFEQGGILSCYICCCTGRPVLRSHPKDNPPFERILREARGTGDLS